MPFEVECFQKPHPPLWYGVVNPDSAERAAKAGMNFISNSTAAAVKAKVARYTAAYQSKGGETPKFGMNRYMVLADTEEKALEIGRRAYRRWWKSFMHLWLKHNTAPGNVNYPPELDGQIADGRAIATTPAKALDILRGAACRVGSQLHGLPLRVRRSFIVGIDALAGAVPAPCHAGPARERCGRGGITDDALPPKLPERRGGRRRDARARQRGDAQQAWPTQPIRWVVGFPPGGSGDIVARIMAGWLAERLGQTVVIENKPGASTNISIQTVVNSPPDGNTLLFIAASAALNVSLFDNLPFDLQRDIVPVAAIIDFPLVLLVNPKLPAKTVPELIAYAKANPGKISIGSFGTGTTSHVAGELFKQTAGIDMVHVPYRGGAPMMTDLIGGQVQVAVDVLTGALPHIQSGQIRALAMAGATRYAGLPDVPTIGETMPLFVANSWCGVGVPRGTPPEIVARLNREIEAGLARPRGAGQADDARDHADVLHAPGVRRLYRLRNREVAEGGARRQHQGAVGSRRNSAAPGAV